MAGGDRHVRPALSTVPAIRPPPTCQFGFGDTVIDCIVTDVGITEKLFNQDLRPLRAEVSVSLVEVVLYENMPTPPPQS